MGVVGTLGGYFLYKIIRLALGMRSWRSMAIATSVAAWTSVVAASILTGLELGLSGTVPLDVALVALVSWHLLIGVGEALITVMAVSFIWRSRPDLFYDLPRSQRLPNG